MSSKCVESRASHKFQVLRILRLAPVRPSTSRAVGVGACHDNETTDFGVQHQKFVLVMMVSCISGRRRTAGSPRISFASDADLLRMLIAWRSSYFVSCRGRRLFTSITSASFIIRMLYLIRLMLIRLLSLSVVPGTPSRCPEPRIFAHLSILAASGIGL